MHNNSDLNLNVNDLRVLIVSDNLLARVGLSALLQDQSGIRIVGQTTSGETLLDDVEVYQPDVILFDLGWEATSVDTMMPLAESGIPTLALIADDNNAPAALAALADFSAGGLLLRDTPVDTLAAALTAVTTGLIVIEPVLMTVIAPDAPPSPTDAPVEKLTSREEEVLHLMARGMTNKAIAHDLGITEHTVKFHVNSIMSKLDAQSRTEAVVRATRAGLVIL